MTFPRRKFAARSDTSKYGKRHKPGEMNQTEASYAELLQGRKLSGEIVEWRFESVTFKLAGDTRYTPDFEVINADGSKEYVDAKGGGPIDPKSIVKVKCAAEKWFEYTFVIEQRTGSKRNGYTWTRKEF